jgi:phage gpG-like protein
MLRELYTSPQGPVYRELNRKGRQVLQQARGLAPVDQGQLRASLKMEMDEERGLPVVRVGTNVKYAIFVHEGTGIHGPRRTPIVPVRARVLRWPVKNQSGSGRRRYRGGGTEQYAYAKSVKGVKARPFLTTALERVTGQS